MITDCYDIDTDPIISLKDFYGDPKYIVDVCLITFSREIHEHILSSYDCEEIAVLKNCNYNTPIYRFNYKGKNIAFYLTAIGSAMAGTQCYEASWITGAKKFVMFGSCGSLDREKTRGKFIIPTESYRGEGCSYYFAKPADYISIKNSQKVSRIFDDLGAPYVMGRVWTTDSMVRETKGLVAKRKAEGCIAVEMEVAGVQAVCDFYNLELYDFLEAGDVLESSGYEVEGLHKANHDFAKLYLALEIAIRI